MKFKSFLLIFSCFFFVSFMVEKAKNDLQRANLKGSVKSATWYTYKGVIKMGLPEKDSLQLKSISEFDSKGNKTVESSYKADGSLIYKWTYTHDEHGNETSYTAENKRGITTTKYSYKLDSTGKVSEMYIFKSDGSLVSKNRRKYDDKGNEIESDSYDNSGPQGAKSTFVYDDKGNLTVSTNYNSSGVIEVRTIFSSYDANGSFNEETFKSPIFNYHHLYKHDDKGNMTEMKVLNKDGSVVDFTYQYEYDKMGNWTKKIVYNNDKLQSILEQEIQYY